jgi:hypothetical protein
MQAGQSRAVTLTLTSLGGYTGTVTLGCGPLPSYLSCVFTSQTVTITAENSPVLDTLTVAVGTTSAARLAPPVGGREKVLQAVLGIPFALAGLVLVSAGRRRGSADRRKRFLLLLVLLTAVMGGLISCGGGSSSGAPATGSSVPAGTQTITVTAVDANQVSHPVTLSVTIQ